MTRKEVYKEVEDMFGFVPTFLTSLPDPVLGPEWELFKRYEIEEGLIPGKYRQLIGLGIHAVSKCRYCILFHTEMARLNGATDAEIEEALEYAKSTAGWSAYINGLQLNYENFKDEVRRAVEYVRHRQMAKKAA